MLLRALADSASCSPPPPCRIRCPTASANACIWVSEGKTTDEVALILGVSSNTVNSYITHAIQKFAASNRAMAIATAIRSGII